MPEPTARERLLDSWNIETRVDAVCLALEAAAEITETDVSLCVQANMGSTASALSAAAIRIRALAEEIRNAAR